MKVGVVGCGYVGLVSAVGLASLGHHVTGIETDGARLARILAGDPPFHEPGLRELLGTALRDGTLRATGDLAGVADADVVLLAVQTPPREDGSIDLTFLRTATGALTRVLAGSGRTDGPVVAIRSTVVPGTTDTHVAPILAAGAAGIRAAAASNPEFLREGSAMQDFLEPDRVVVGTHERWAATRMEELYRPLGAPLVHTTPATAELTKYASNALLATLVSFSNELAHIAESSPGVDVDDVLDILHMDRRLQPAIGEGQRLAPAILSYLRAGCGFGGSCLPKDVSALAAHAHTNGERTPLLDAVCEINTGQPARLVDLAERELNGLVGRRVAVLGLAFKAGTDDLRASPGIRVVEELRRRGADVVVHDPLVSSAAWQAQAVAPEIVVTLEDAVAHADAVVVTTIAEEFTRLPQMLRGRAGPPLVVDGRRALDPTSFAPGGYAALGRAPAIDEAESFPVARDPSSAQPTSRSAAASSAGVPTSR